MSAQGDLFESAETTDRHVLWCMCNPSTADAMQDDTTIRQCRAFSRRILGAEPKARESSAELFLDLRYRFLLTRPGLAVVNLYPLRATDPTGLLGWSDAAAEATNDQIIREQAADPLVARIVVAWGDAAAKVPGFNERVREVCALLVGSTGRHELWCLGRIASGMPRHPSRLAHATPLERWAP